MVTSWVPIAFKPLIQDFGYQDRSATVNEIQEGFIESDLMVLKGCYLVYHLSAESS